MVDIIRIAKADLLWPELVAHLERQQHLRHVSNEQGIRPDLYWLAALEGGAIVGHLSFCRQPLLVPSDPPTPLLLGGEALVESFVQTFLVEEAARGRGHGIRLQRAAIAWSQELGCRQLRSWSSLDKAANYALKLQLGFAFCPGEFIVPTTGQRIPGGWFVKQLRRAGAVPYAFGRRG